MDVPVLSKGAMLQRDDSRARDKTVVVTSRECKGGRQAVGTNELTWRSTQMEEERDRGEHSPECHEVLTFQG